MVAIVTTILVHSLRTVRNPNSQALDETPRHSKSTVHDEVPEEAGPQV